MPCSPYLTDLALNIWLDLSQPTGQPPSYIQSKLVSQPYVGQLNNQLATCYTAVSGDISPALGDTEQGIYSLLYQYNYYSTQLNRVLQGLNPGVVSLADGDSRIVFTNPVDIARMYRDAAKEASANLIMQVSAYRQQASQPAAVDMPFVINDLGYGVDGNNQPAGFPRGYYRS